ncbi:unnamed protein product [Spirodela intermedia]|uniref:Uncharacterized protein n=1 Tax=Spirodela intermedia TaxID=51605 RepID=A0A7I8I7J9_SPIIN|nr:unnamed protein product [Spirodela intermedia]CAA6653587.1 unnamed protein product [Spirodela intermedia]
MVGERERGCVQRRGLCSLSSTFHVRRLLGLWSLAVANDHLRAVREDEQPKEEDEEARKNPKSSPSPNRAGSLTSLSLLLELYLSLPVAESAQPLPGGRHEPLQPVRGEERGPRPTCGLRVCSSCGVEQCANNFQSQAFTSDGHPTGVIVQSVGVSSTRERKIYLADTEIGKITSGIGLSAARSAEVRAMVSEVTEGEFGAGNWFTVLVAACICITMRKNRLPLSIAEAAASIGRDTPGISSSVRREVVPLHRAAASPLVAAVTSFVAEVNGVAANLEEIADYIYARPATCKLRKRELLMTLVKVAKVLLPWGEDVTAKNIFHNAPYFKLSAECLSHAYEKASLLSKAVEPSGESEKSLVRKRNREDMLRLCFTSYGGISSEDLSLEQILERDVGYDPPPPSFLAGLEARQRRKEKIAAAKHRIRKAIRPSSDNSGRMQCHLPLDRKGAKKRRRQGAGGIDWEDCMIELLLLHRANEEEIEHGHYRRLMDLHVFTSMNTYN